MCGIFAVVAGREGALDADAAHKARMALEAIAHRGPDARGLWIDPTNTVLLGHVRLSVIDPTPESDQPFWSDCGQHGVVFNGEIYNFVEIRADLEREGKRFRTGSDTEVLLAALMAWGPDAVKRFNGMWAFAYVNLRARTVLVCRDRFGVKPLYMGRDDGATVFASEAKAIVAYMRRRPTPNRESIALYLKYGIGGEHEHSWYEGIDRFPPARLASLDWHSGETRHGTPRRYWEYPTTRQAMSADDAQAELAELLSDAVRIRLRSDVPLGLSLSGGLDSSIIAWILRDRFDRGVEAYSAWFEPRRQSEIERAERTSSRYGHRLHPVPEPSSDAIADDLARCIWHLDSPHLSTAIVPYLNICTNARRSLTVMLEGQGADELLGGYAFLYPFATVDYLASGALRQAWMTFAAETRAGNLKSTLGNLLAYSSGAFAERPSRAWGSEVLSTDLLDCRHPDPLRFGARRDNLDHALRNEHSRRLGNLLQYGDALSMSVNLETRCPFMDYRVVEFGFRLPTSLLIRDGAGKHVQRRIAERHLDRDIVWPARKDGFTNKTVARLRDHVARHGVSTPAIQDAIELGLLRHGSATSSSLMQLSDEPFYRIMSTLIWVDQWAARSRPAARHRPACNLPAP